MHLPLPAVYLSNPLSGCLRKDLVEEETVDLSSVSQAQGRVASASRRGRNGFPPARVSFPSPRQYLVLDEALARRSMSAIMVLDF